MHLHTVALQQATMEFGRADFGSGLFGRQQFDLGVDLATDQLAGSRQPLVVLGLGGQLELAAALEIAGDPLLLHQRDHALYRAFIGTVIGTRTFGAEAGDEAAVILGNPRVAMPTVTPGGLADHPAGLQYRHARPFQGQRPGRRQAGEAAADDDDIDSRRQRAGLSASERRCGIEPVGLTAHG
ncbi:hypothetical protein D9M68_799720 [compost metagenome]